MKSMYWFNRKIVRTSAAGGGRYGLVTRSGSVTRSYRRKARVQYYVRPALRI